MEDRHVKLISIVKKVLIFILVIGGGALIIFFGYKFVMEKINTDKFTGYLEDNDYDKKKNGSYLKKTKSGDIETHYKALTDDSIISKETYEETELDYLTISLKYGYDGNIVIGLQYEGFNKNNDYGVLYQTGEYNDGEFNCKIVTGNNFDTKCSDMKSAAEDFDKEVNSIMESNDISYKFIK